MGWYHAIIGAGNERLGDAAVGGAAGHKPQARNIIGTDGEVACRVGLQVIDHAKAAWLRGDAGEGTYRLFEWPVVPAVVVGNVQGQIGQLRTAAGTGVVDRSEYFQRLQSVGLKPACLVFQKISGNQVTGGMGNHNAEIVA